MRQNPVVKQRRVLSARLSQQLLHRYKRGILDRYAVLPLNRIGIEHSVLVDKVYTVAVDRIARQGRSFSEAEVEEAVAREAFRLAMHKLPVKCKFVMKDGESND